MNDIAIVPIYTTIEKHNPISGHTWTEFTGEIKGYEVSGGFFCRTFHRKLDSAEKEKQIRKSMVTKFPFDCPRSEREINKAKKLNLKIK